MNLIAIEAYPNGGRPPIITMGGKVVPIGYAICPDEFVKVFYSTNPAGFVHIEVDEETNTVTKMSLNKEALYDYRSTNPATATKRQPTAQDDTDAMLVDQEYRLTLLELGLNE